MPGGEFIINLWGQSGSAGMTWGEIATIVATGIAIFSLFVAMAAYLSSAEAARSAHMHNLFRDYLNQRGGGIGDGVSGTETPVSIRLYVLEEMHAWTVNENRWFLRLPLLVFQRESVRAWEETILVHAGYDFEEVVANIADYRHCYGLRFLRFLDEHLTPERVLTSIAGKYFRSGREIDLDKEQRDIRSRRIVAADNYLAEVVAAEGKRRSRRGRKAKPWISSSVEPWIDSLSLARLEKPIWRDGGRP